MEKLHLDGPEGQTFTTLGATVGQLSFEAGTRLPEVGVSVHAQNEISFIHSGVLRAYNGDDPEPTLIRAGDVTFIPAGETHWAEVLEDVRLSYVLLD